MPEENHWAKGDAWSRLGAYRLAIWHFRKFLKYSEDSRVRAHLGWCYANLGMLEAAAEHYRLAYARLKDPSVAIGLAQVERDLGNRQEALAIVEYLNSRRSQFDGSADAALTRLEDELRKARSSDENDGERLSV